MELDETGYSDGQVRDGHLACKEEGVASYVNHGGPDTGASLPGFSLGLPFISLKEPLLALLAPHFPPLKDEASSNI